MLLRIINPVNTTNGNHSAGAPIYGLVWRLATTEELVTPIHDPATLSSSFLAGGATMRDRIAEACYSIAHECVASDNLMSRLAMGTPQR